MKRIPLFFQMLLMASLAGAVSVRLWDDSHVPGIFVEVTVGDSLNGIFMLDTGATAFGLVLDSASFARLDTSSFSVRSRKTRTHSRHNKKYIKL